MTQDDREIVRFEGEGGHPAPSDASARADGEPGDEERPARRLAEPALAFDFTELSKKLRQEHPWLQHGSNAVTLVKQPDFRIVFMLLKAGTFVQEHHARNTISVQTVSGRVRLHLKDRVVDLPGRHLLALGQGVVHDLEAIEESEVLLTIAWSGGREAGR